MPQTTETQKTDVRKKPLLFADGMYASNRRDGAEFRHAEVDASYIPYYSEERSLNELREAKHPSVRGQKPTPLPVLAWVRVHKVDGTGVTHGDPQLTSYRLLGYRAMSWDDLKELQVALGAPGIELPPTAHFDEVTGLIMREDTALFFVGADRAATNRRDLDQRSAELATVGNTTGPVYRDTEAEVTIKAPLDEIQRIEIPT